MSHTAMKTALSALNEIASMNGTWNNGMHVASYALKIAEILRAAIAEAEAEKKENELSAAMMAQDYCRSLWGAARGRPEWREANNGFVAGYLAAGAQERKPLTDEQIYSITGVADRDEMMHRMARNIARAIEQAHGIKGQP